VRSVILFYPVFTVSFALVWQSGLVQVIGKTRLPNDIKPYSLYRDVHPEGLEGLYP